MSRHRISGPRVVVLNASFEPLGVVPLRKALLQIHRERAVIVEAVPGLSIRSASLEIPFPRVVQFREMIRVPYRFRAEVWTRAGVFRRDDHRCAYCLKPGTTIDHVMPQSRGGRNTWMNTVVACMRCNNEKADRTPEEANMPLLYPPREVSSRDSLVLAIAATGADMEMLGLAMPASVLANA